MNRDTRDEALDRIRDIADLLLTRDGLPVDVSRNLKNITALAVHRDCPDVVKLEDKE